MFGAAVKAALGARVAAAQVPSPYPQQLRSKDRYYP
jgi:hypothetical protein